MQRMTGLDASFLYMESPRLPMHTLKLAVLDVADVPGGYQFKRVLDLLGGHMHLLPAMRRRIVAVPLGLHHPLWIDDPAFRVEDHVSRARLPDGAGEAELDALLAEIAEQPLPRDRPLWQLWAAEGMTDADGRPLVAFIAKVHHALGDGLATAEMLRRAMIDVSPLPEPPPAPVHLPGPAALARKALGEHLRQLAGLPPLIAASVRGGLRARRLARGEVRPPRLFSGPRTLFNRTITARRDYTRLELPLAEFKRIKRTFACTVNDVVLAVVAGALRRYLQAHGEPCDFPLIASVPSSTGGTHPAGNHVSSLYSALRADIADPVERLRQTKLATDAAKRKHAALGEDMLARWLEFTRLAPHAWLWRRLLPRLRRPPVHLVVSNVPGPRVPLEIDGARLVRLASVGPLLEGVGLNITVWSYVDTMSFSILSCPDSLPAPDTLAAAMRASLEELLALVPAPAAEPVVASA
jgi:diacylglycerol O-acyltransferase